MLFLNTCEVWEARAGVQVSKREFRTHIHLDQARVEILSCIKKKKKKKKKKENTLINTKTNTQESLRKLIYATT